MKFSEMTNEQLSCYFFENVNGSSRVGTFSGLFIEAFTRLVKLEAKQSYTIKYKWTLCDVEIEKSPAFTVWGTSPIDAAKTLVDANNWRGQDMEFLVNLKGSDNSTCFTSNELE